MPKKFIAATSRNFSISRFQFKFHQDYRRDVFNFDLIFDLIFNWSMKTYPRLRSQTKTYPLSNATYPVEVASNRAVLVDWEKPVPLHENAVLPHTVDWTLPPNCAWRNQAPWARNSNYWNWNMGRIFSPSKFPNSGNLTLNFWISKCPGILKSPNFHCKKKKNRSAFSGKVAKAFVGKMILSDSKKWQDIWTNLLKC